MDKLCPISKLNNMNICGKSCAWYEYVDETCVVLSFFWRLVGFAQRDMARERREEMNGGVKRG